MGQVLGKSCTMVDLYSVTTCLCVSELLCEHSTLLS